jgi:hypothetical protein
MKRQEKTIRGKPYKEIVTKLNYFCETIPQDRYETYRIFPNGKSVKFRELVTRANKLFSVLANLKKGLPTSIRLKIVNASVEIKNSVRLFYPDQGLSARKGKIVYAAKVGLESAFRNGSLANEIAAKAFVEKKMPRFPIPKTYSYDTLNQGWFVEEYISGTSKASNHQKASLFLSKHAFDFYSPFFFPLTLERFLSKQHLSLDLLQGIFQEAGVSFEELHPRSTLAGAYIHGDLAPINLLVDDQGRLYVIDWEHFGEGAVALDLVKLMKIDLRQAVAALSRISQVGQGCSLSAAQQFKIALGIEVIQHRRNVENILNFHVEHAGKNLANAKSMLSTAEKETLALMSRLSY